MGNAIAIFGALVVLAGIVLLFKKGRRKVGAFWFMGGVLIFLTGAAIGGRQLQEDRARESGYESAAEMQAAAKAGFSDPALYRTAQAEQKAKLEAETAAAQNRAQQAALEEQRRKIEAEANCPKELKCWAEKYSSAATGPCTRVVERLAKNSHKWTDSWYEPKFSHFRWASKDQGVVTYIGDKVQYQNGFGAWINHTYECDYNPNTKQVVDARARPGLLPN